MRKLLFIFSACCSFGMICAQRGNEWNANIDRQRPRLSAVAEIAGYPELSKEYIRELKTCCSVAYEDPLKLEERGFKLFYRNESKDTVNFAGFTRQIGDRLIVSFPGTRVDDELIDLASTVKSSGETLKEFSSKKSFDRVEAVLRVRALSAYIKTLGHVGPALRAATSDLIADVRGIGDDGGFSDWLKKEDVVVHSGFAKEVMEFYEAMQDQINSYDGVEEICFTGHSKGGAVAILTALRYAFDTQYGKLKKFRIHNAIKVYTFAAPCVLNDEGVSLFHRIIDPYNAICIYKNLDAVPYLPFAFSVLPERWKKGADFYHIGVQANISKSGKEVLDSALEMTGIKSLFNKKSMTNLDVVSSLKKQVEQMKIAENPVKLALNIASNIASQIGKDIGKAHLIANFSDDSISEIVDRIKGNYDLNQEMGRNRIGRDSRPFLRSLAFWKK